MERKIIKDGGLRHSTPTLLAKSGLPTLSQGSTNSGMGVEQVQSIVKKEVLQGLIAKVSNLQDKKALKSFVAQHLPNGKYFSLLCDVLQISKDFELSEIATLYEEDKDAADTAYASIVENRKLSHKTRKDALALIINPEKLYQSRLSYLTSMNSNNRAVILSVIASIGDKNTKINTCISILPKFINNNTLVKEILKNFEGLTDASIDNILYDSIEKSHGLEFRDFSVLELIKDSTLKSSAKKLIKHKGQETTERLQQEILLYLKNPNIEISSKVNKINASPLPKDFLYAVLALDNLDDKEIAMVIAENIKDRQKKAEVYCIITHDITNKREIFQFFKRFFIKELGLRPEELSVMIKPNHPLYASGILIKHFLQHNLPELLVDPMNASIEGLEGEALESVKKTKLAAARVLLKLDNENIDALTTILSLEAEGNDSPYALYKIVVEKSKESVSLEDMLAQKQEQLASVLANGEKVCLSASIYALPVVMDAEWQKDFENINFGYFTGVIQNLCQDYRETKERALSQTDDIDQIERLKKDIKENEILEQDYLKYFNEDGRSVLQNTLNSKNATSSHGNKMKAIALHIDKLRQEGKMEDALTKLAELRENMQTCQGGDQQAIETVYMHIRFADSGALQINTKGLTVAKTALIKEGQKVFNTLYKIRLNWVLENTNELCRGVSCVQYSPEGLGESFPEKLSMLLNNPCLGAYRAFGNTHKGLAIMGIAGIELGLRAANSHPSFDANCACAGNFITDIQLTKNNILDAFINAFTFENTWKAIGQALWDSLATASNLPLKKQELFSDEACTQNANLSALNTDPMTEGLKAFLGSIEEAKKALANENLASDSQHEYIQFNLKQAILKLMEQQECYYKDPKTGDVDSLILYTGFSKEALARILIELGILSVVD